MEARISFRPRPQRSGARHRNRAITGRPGLELFEDENEQENEDENEQEHDMHRVLSLLAESE